MLLIQRSCVQREILDGSMSARWRSSFRALSAVRRCRSCTWRVGICNISPQCSVAFSHRINILISPANCFLSSLDCKSTLRFTDRLNYGAIARQFEFHSCGSSQRRFVLVRCEGKGPVMASCAKCEHKLFTPSSTFARDHIGAELSLVS